MSKGIVRLDVEGTLVQFASVPPLHYGKQLPVATAWQVFEVRDLENVVGTPVQAVRTDAAESCHEIHYHPALTPLHLAAVRELLSLDGPLALWRVTKLALDLCDGLAALHDEGIPQFVMHPERIGQWGGKFALVPTLAGVLPALDDAPPNEVSGWLHFVAPEVLRTRGLNKDLLFAGDVYALGRTLEALCLPHWEAATNADWFVLAAQRVEANEPQPLGELATHLSELRPLLARMTALLPDARPSLAVAQAELAALNRQCAPVERFQTLLSAKRMDEIEACLRDLAAMDKLGVFGSWARTVRLLTADLALAQTPPDCQRAINELYTTNNTRDFYELDVQQRLAKAYALHTDQSDHLLRSSEAYARAASLSHWAAHVLEEWVPVLWQLNQPDLALDVTQDIPVERRTRGIIALRSQCWEQKSAFLDAWYEVTTGFVRLPFDAALYELARRIARRNEPLALIRWLTPHRNKPAFAAAESLVWEVNGNRELAEVKLQEAQAYTPPSGD